MTVQRGRWVQNKEQDDAETYVYLNTHVGYPDTTLMGVINQLRKNKMQNYILFYLDLHPFTDFFFSFAISILDFLFMCLGV